MEIIRIPISELTPDPNNAKDHPEEQIQQIEESIRRWGFNDPLGVWGDENLIVEGHGRYEALKRLGYDEVECIRLDQLTDEERRAYALVHNNLTMNTGWIPAALDLNLDAIGAIDMSQFGFDIPGIDNPMEAEDDNYDGAVPDQPRSQTGQIWVLGNHRLMCGDSANPEDMKNLMGGGKAKLVFTDPPYGVAIGDKNKMLDEVSGGRKSGRIKTNIEGDTLSTSDLYDLLLRAFKNLRENCSDDCSYYVSSPQGGEIGLMMMMMRDAGLEVRHNLIWEKSAATFSMGRLDYDYKHEPIFYTWTKKHHFYGKGKCKNTIWQFPKPRKCDLHPTMKPVELVAECLLNSSIEGDIVADIFGGSGTTMIACEQLNRKCYMMEKDPHYVDVIIDRWEQFTGGKAVLLNEES